MSHAQDPGTTVAETDLLKGLARLEKITKAQITGKLPGNSGPKGRWSEGKEPHEVTDDESDISDDGGEDERNGKKSDTDYKPKAAPVQKGLGESGDDEGADDGEDDDDDDDEDLDDLADELGDGEGAGGEGGGQSDDTDKDKDVDKSFLARARASKPIRSGVEVSPFLRDLVRVLGKSLAAMERRLARDLGAQLDRDARSQAVFAKALTKVLSSMSAVSLEQGELLKGISAQPARGLKSQLHAVRPVQKSFDSGEGEVTLPDGTTVPQLDRGVLMQRLLQAVDKGFATSMDVIKYESTGVVNPSLYRSLATNPELAK